MGFAINLFASAQQGVHIFLNMISAESLTKQHGAAVSISIAYGRNTL
jgi:hypothetical protein